MSVEGVINEVIYKENEYGIRFYFNEAALKYNEPKIRDMPFSLEDRGAGMKKVYSMCYNKNRPESAKFCGPDFTFKQWQHANIDEFEKMRDRIIAAGENDPAIDKVGWAGNIKSPLPDVPEHQTRQVLKMFGDEYPDIFDIRHIMPQNSMINESIPQYISLPDLIKYKYLIDIGGNGYSGRLKYLLFSRRPIFLVDRDYIEYFHKDLMPFVHYIPVKQDLTDLLDRFMWAVNNPQKATEIAENAYDYAVENFTFDKICDRVYYVWRNLRETGVV